MSVRRLQISSEREEKENTDHLEGLPDELIKELSSAYKRGSISRSDQEILDGFTALFEQRGEPLTLDDILVGFYREFKTVLKRSNLTNSLLRLHAKDKIARPDRKRYAAVKQA